jgi:hypothetical protein
MTEQIYVPLLDEGLRVWRPVPAEKISDDTYVISTELDPTTLEEEWEFPPGSTVICQPKKTAEGTVVAAVRLASVGSAHRS